MSSQPRTITADDLNSLVQVHDPQAHGSKIAWVETHIDDELDTYTSAIWVGSADGSNVRKLTSGTFRDANPRWSPDGTYIAFTSNRPPSLPSPTDDTEKTESKADKKKSAKKNDKKKHPNQVWIIRLDGGEAQQVSNLEYGT